MNAATDLFLIPKWVVPPNVQAVMTLRGGNPPCPPFFKGGNNFDNFNLATHVGDDLNHVLENRKWLTTKLNLPAEPFWLEQIHSNWVVNANENLCLPQADASFSNCANTVCVVMTADCLPVLLCSQDGLKIAAIHAGWRGLANGIISNTVEKLHTNQLIAWLGAAIGKDCFEVGDDVRDTFLQKSLDYKTAFRGSKNKWLADIYQLARIELTHLGITQIYGGNFCTVSDSRFYSYRRDNPTGRMATLIWRT